MARRRQPKDKKVTVRFDAATYAALERAAENLDLNVSEYIRLLALRSAEVVNVSLVDYAAQEMLKQVTAELERLRRYWQEHPEQLFQAMPRRPEPEEDA
jgi:uncharacterized protein (DUF1778 family)